MTKLSLSDLGWSAHFEVQLDPAEDTLMPLRITSVERDSVQGLGETGAAALILPSADSAGDYAVGDWVLTDPTSRRIIRRLDRLSLLQRRAAGTGRETQLIAANIDTLFIVTSCNADFNPARLERYLVLAAEAGVAPVILLTKADAVTDSAPFIAEARALSATVPIEALNAKDHAVVNTLINWLGRGRTGALVGSSGVGKTTLLNAMTKSAAATGDIREVDAKGRHTTTARGLFPALGGSWLVDTPGMRAVRLSDVSDGIDAVFADLIALGTQCRFSDCAHDAEPGCAVQAAISAGIVTAERLERWQKLAGEETQNTAEMHHKRRRDKSLQKLHRSKKVVRKHKGRPES